LSLLLIALLASCPIVCGTAHARSGDDGGGHGHAKAPGSPLPAPANDDDCACNGAVKAADAWSSSGLSDLALSLDSPFALLFQDLLALVPTRSTRHEGVSASWFGDARSCALRSVLRC
jgi:hypothetical protein